MNVTTKQTLVIFPPILSFMCLVGLILHFGFWATLGGFLQGIFWIISAVVAIILVFLLIAAFVYGIIILFD